MKSKLFVFGAACALMLAGCGGSSGNTKVKATSVEIDESSIELEVGQSHQLYAYVKPDNADNKDVTWSASGDGIVSVDEGLVTALKVGTSTVTVTTVDGGYKASCAVTVTAATVPVTGVYLDKTSATIKEDETLTLKATVQPDNATDKRVTWFSSDESVATVDDGVVTALKAGTSNIKVMTNEGLFEATCALTVEAASTKPADAVDLAFATDQTLSQHGDDYCYFNNPEWWEGASADVNEAYYSASEGIVVYDYTYKPESSTSVNWSVQLMRKNTSLTQGTTYELSFKINSSKAGQIIVNDTFVDIVQGDNNVSVTYKEGAGASLLIQFSLNLIGSARVVLSNIAWEAALVAPEGVVVNKDGDDYIVAFAAVAGVEKYKAYYVNSATSTDVANEEVTNGGKLTKVSTLEDGKYKVFVTSIKGEKESARSKSYGTIEIGEVAPVVPAGGPKTNMEFGEEHDNATGLLKLPDDKFVYWNDQHWCGSTIAVSDAYTEEGTVHATYAVTEQYDPWNQGYEGCDFGFQIFYKNTSLKAGSNYTLSYKLTSVLGGTVKANGTEITLTAGQEYSVSVNYEEIANNASFALVFSSRMGANNTIVISNLSWSELK